MHRRSCSLKLEEVENKGLPSLSLLLPLPVYIMEPQNSWAKCSMMMIGRMDGSPTDRPTTDLIFLHNNGIFRFNTPIPSEGERERAPHAGGTSKSKDDDHDDDDSESEIAAKLQLLCIQKTGKCSQNREKADLVLSAVHYPRKRVLCSSRALPPLMLTK